MNDQPTGDDGKPKREPTRFELLKEQADALTDDEKREALGTAQRALDRMSKGAIAEVKKSIDSMESLEQVRKSVVDAAAGHLPDLAGALADHRITPAEPEFVRAFRETQEEQQRQVAAVYAEQQEEKARQEQAEKERVEREKENLAVAKESRDFAKHSRQLAAWALAVAILALIAGILVPLLTAG